MKISMNGQEKDYLLIEVTTWAGLTVCSFHGYAMTSENDFAFHYVIFLLGIWKRGDNLEKNITKWKFNLH